MSSAANLALYDTARRAALAKAEAGELLSPEDVMAILHLQKSRYYEIHKAGALEGLKVRPALGPRCYSGRKVMRYLAGEPMLGEKELQKVEKRLRKRA